MSNTLLFSSPLGQTYFSVLGNPEVLASKKDVFKSILSVIKFYKQKEADKDFNKRERAVTANAQFWSVFILLIVNEYSMGRHMQEDNSDLKGTLSAAEISEIPQEKLDNYVNCSKIMNVITEYMKNIPNIKIKEKEIVVFIGSFIKICSNMHGRDTLSCVMSLLRFRNILTDHQKKKICGFIKKISEDMADNVHKQILGALVSEFQSAPIDTFGLIVKNDRDEENKNPVKNEQDDDSELSR
jgi:hypothetical protein